LGWDLEGRFCLGAEVVGWSNGEIELLEQVGQSLFGLANYSLPGHFCLRNGRFFMGFMAPTMPKLR